MKQISKMVLMAALVASLGLIACNRGQEVSNSDRKSSKTGIVGEILYLEGAVSVNGLTAEIGDTVKDGDVITTALDALVEVEFGSQRALRASDGARLVLDSSNKEFVLESGALAVVQSKIKSLFGRGTWDVRTPTTVAAVRGTVYYIRVESPEQTYFCLCNGRIRLENEDSHIDLEANHHQAVLAVRTPNGVEYKDGTFLYHTDEVMESLAQRVQVTIDWTKISH